SEQVTTDNMGYADITINLPSIPVQYEIQVMGPLINTYFEAYYGLVTSSPITTSSPISSPISPQPISVAVINMQTGESVVLTNSNPTAVLPPSTQFYVQITNGQPNSTYNISASATCPDGSADNTSLQLTTNSSGTVGGSIGFTCSPVGYQIKITGPLINNYFEAYYTYVPPRSGPVPK
ncbi:MAG: hypothetical protein QXJ23_10655, partial [Thermofilum sp.]|uniref:hypothetical protein n=1 Tax=Thermofilum sp. TaxID=1961369 RepID=UPI00317DA65E